MSDLSSDLNQAGLPERLAPIPTGGTIVLFRRGTSSKAMEKVVKAANMPVIHSKDMATKSESIGNGNPKVTVFDALGIAVVDPMEGANALVTSLAQEDDVEMVRPEFYMFASQDWHTRYQAWVRSGIHLLADWPDVRGETPGLDLKKRPVPSLKVGEGVTWGVAAIGAGSSKYSGKGIKVAVLDTGIALLHPDFKSRKIVAKSFVEGESSVEDLVGHGTHCAGTICGPRKRKNALGYGVAPDVALHVGRVLNGAGAGREKWVINGIEWAIQSECEVISMSLGRATSVEEEPDPVYESVGERALEKDCLVIAAAGNESHRQFGYVSPVGSPANCQSFMAVGSVNEKMLVSTFSCGGLMSPGGEVDIAGPGENVFSSYLLPKAYAELQGTSMATPHVAGVAALYAEMDPQLRGRKLWDRLVSDAKALPNQHKRDVGAGLVQSV